MAGSKRNPDSYAHLAQVLRQKYVPEPTELPHVTIGVDPPALSGSHRTSKGDTSEIFNRLSRYPCGLEIGRRDDLVAKSRAYDIKMCED